MTKLTWEQSSSPDPYFYFKSFLLVYLYKATQFLHYTIRKKGILVSIPSLREYLEIFLSFILLASQSQISHQEQYLIDIFKYRYTFYLLSFFLVIRTPP